jgi:RNA polymerase sigma-70 factor (ECF subfamily)
MLTGAALSPPDAAISDASMSLSRSEATAAIARLADGEKTALMKIARLYARATPYDHQDLIHEALARVIEGRRKWPRDADAVRFLGGVIRSIAWEWKSEAPPHAVHSTDVLAPQRSANAAIDAARVVALFDDDPAAKQIVLAIMDGARGEELRELSGLAQPEYESKRKKIRRRIEKFYNTGQ